MQSRLRKLLLPLLKAVKEGEILKKKDLKAPSAQSKRLTEQERKRLAKEARQFAMECVDGTEPRYGLGRLWYRNGRPCCAVGHILARAGLHPEWADEIGATKDLMVATDANDLYPDALPFALLALADALEDARSAYNDE